MLECFYVVSSQDTGFQVYLELAAQYVTRVKRLVHWNFASELLAYCVWKISMKHS